MVIGRLVFIFTLSAIYLYMDTTLFYCRSIFRFTGRATTATKSKTRTSVSL